MRRHPSSESLFAKTITDVSIAQVLEVEPGLQVISKDTRKRTARTSPMDPKGDWTLKCSRSTSSPSPVASQAERHGNKGMELQFSLVVSIKDDNAESDVVKPTQPPQSP